MKMIQKFFCGDWKSKITPEVWFYFQIVLILNLWGTVSGLLYDPTFVWLATEIEHSDRIHPAFVLYGVADQWVG